jgi:hypothetical protein
VRLVVVVTAAGTEPWAREAGDWGRRIKLGLERMGMVRGVRGLGRKEARGDWVGSG